jgi:hypothetical protein
LVRKPLQQLVRKPLQQRCLSALSNQSGFKLSHGGHLCEQETPYSPRRHTGQVAERQVHVSSDKAR